LSIIGADISKTSKDNGICTRFKSDQELAAIVGTVEKLFLDLSGYLSMLESDRGATVTSNFVSRTTQRKIFSLLSAQPLIKEGRLHIMNILRSMAERIVSEILVKLQNNGHTSSNLWTSVRARGCQFLGPGFSFN
jgi:RING finger/CCCH-type zinc finger protein